ncbi:MULTISPECIES: alpha-amylase family glycosyl hydrolase [unclassified Mycoplasma]|uniref:alpha-amylase family glycosyl hydrolase n=1 Tax=unclassified Mycoplasma TaxID=2683645 RepID=UPI00211BFF55|nr:MULTISPECIES: alpha-amylase family glycosyl hydrolase [unclassified Mycoplasma]UUM19758.1 alpha-amylase family glycosyl hydrolase [Mycoplasma sp. 1578d]UUM24741.1 alpha-amylase family glycosyl hydrolase [Mycoplasma sp. 3686d]
MKIRNLKWLFLTTPLISVVSVACNNVQIQKQERKWGELFFAQNYSNRLSYVEEANNAQFLAPFEPKNKSNTIYQLTVYSFADGNNDGIGDFIGLKNNLDYFVNLGINTLYLSPIHPSSSYHGYDVIDYLGVAPELGGEQAFKDFLIQAHKRGIKVVLDLVFNHTSYEHPWFQKALQGDKKYQDYYYFLPDNVDENTPGLGIDNDWIRGIFQNLKNKNATNKKYVAEFWAGMPDLNLNNPKVIKEIESVQKYWSKLGVDGFRYDAFYHFFDSKNPYKDKSNGNNKINKIFAQLRKSSEQAYNDKRKRSNNTPLMFGEWWKTPAESLSYTNVQFIGLDSVIDGSHWKFQSNVGIDYLQEKGILEQMVQNKSTWMPFLDNHDVERWINSVRLANNFTKRNIFRDDPLNENDISMLQYALTSLLSRAGSPILYDGMELNMHGGPKSKGDNLVREAFPWKDNNKQVNFYEQRSGESSSKIFLNLSKNEQKIEDAIKDANSTYSLVAKLNKIRNDYDYVTSQNPNSVANPQDLIFPKTLKGLIVSSNMSLRTNGQGEYLLYVFDWGKNKSEFKLKDNVSIQDILLSKNVIVDKATKQVKTNGVGPLLVMKLKVVE